MLLVARVATADSDTDGEAAFQAAERQAAAGDPHAIEALEQLGAARPVTRWTDDAWAEAARLAERAGDYDRARRDLGQAIAVATDERLRARASADLARISAFTGAAGQWNQVAAEHARLVAGLEVGGDPKPALRQLEALVRAHPQYPRAVLVMLEIARGWQRDGDLARALGWLREAATAPVDDPIVHAHAKAELARGEIRAGELDTAAEQIEGLAPTIAGPLREELRTARHREVVRWLLWSTIAAIAAAALWVLRRAAGSWRAAARRLVRPPGEVLYYLPIAGVLAVIATTGNPMVGRAVRAIAITGAVVGWLSGTILDAVRARTGRIALSRAAGHAVLAAGAVIAATYLAIDHDRMIDLVVETWREGPAPR